MNESDNAMKKDAKDLKILQLGKFHPIRGGVEKVMLDLTTGLSARGISCDMLCAATRGSYTIRLNDRARIIAVRSLANVKATMMSPAMIVRLRRICRQYDIIHIHHPDPMAALALRLIKPLQTWLLKRADVIVTTSPPYLEQSPWLAPYRDKCQCVPIGILPVDDADQRAIDKLRKSVGGRKVVFSMGRLVGYKGFEYLIDAAALLPDDHIVVIGGTGPLRDQLQARIEAAGLTEKVRLLGFVPEEALPVYYRAASLFCMSSVERTEAFGVVLIEAMSCGTPIVATRIPGSGVPWVNADGISGRNAEPRDARSLAEAIMAVTGDSGGKPFTLYKFRTMRNDAEADGQARLCKEEDNRLTKFGAFLRSHHLDELPQLLNVIRGDMSFVGHRPERKVFIDRIMELNPDYTRLYALRPGLFSTATLYNGYTDTIEKMMRRLQMDLDYLANRSLALDCKIIFLTAYFIISGKKF